MRKSPIIDLLLPYAGIHMHTPTGKLAHKHTHMCMLPNPHRYRGQQKEKSKKDLRVTGAGLGYVEIVRCCLSRKTGAVG